MDFEVIKNKSIALVLWNSEKEDDVHIYLGVLEIEHGQYYFVNQEKGWKVSLDNEQVAGLKAVPEELSAALLGADYALNMTIKTLPDSMVDGVGTGMQWHE